MSISDERGIPNTFGQGVMAAIVPKLPLLLGVGAIVTIVSLLAIRHATAIRDITFPTAETPPLVMKGGNPYVRALMRTISASEASDNRPYSLIYGGERFNDFSRHPGKCVPIRGGPNRGKCSTAAGRYQTIDVTWREIARRYHPQPNNMLQRLLAGADYNFAPEYQDIVVYRWLKDKNAWGVDITSALCRNDIDAVRRRLSSTWTSLGYGIEDNFITPRLPAIYRRVLVEELQNLPEGNSANSCADIPLSLSMNPPLK